jgi:hypothetical protein
LFHEKLQIDLRDGYEKKIRGTNGSKFPRKTIRDNLNGWEMERDRLLLGLAYRLVGF